MVTIATRVRDCRYSKGWGPDELASRAEISRTALYQIECGKTETPRASTLRRIAKALDVTIEALMGREDSTWSSPANRTVPARSPEPWNPADLVASKEFAAFEPMSPALPSSRIRPQARPFAPRYNSRRDEELLQKFQELLASPLGDGLARLVEESHRMLPQIGNKHLG